MREVVLTKAVRLAAGRPMSKPGQTVEVDDATFDRLTTLDAVLVDEPAASDASTPAVVDESPEEHAGEDPEPVDEEPETIGVSGDFSDLPDMTAPVAEWKEYARLNGIRLTGLTKKNEIMGFVMKMTSNS